MSTPVAIGAAVLGGGVLPAQRDELVLRIGPGDRGHVGLLGRAQLEMIGPPVGVDDEVGDEVRPRRLDQDVDALGGARAALGVADDPAHGVAGGDRAGADELLAGFERDVGDFARRGIDLIERAVGEGIDLDGVDIAGAGRLHARRAIGLVDARRADRPASGGAVLAPGIGFSWPGSGSGFGSSTICTGLGGSGGSTACLGVSS